jgi:hypothetical protein
MSGMLMKTCWVNLPFFFAERPAVEAGNPVHQVLCVIQD